MVTKYVSKERLLSNIQVQKDRLDDMILYHETKGTSNPSIANSEIQLMSAYMAQKINLEEVETMAMFGDENTLYIEEDGMYIVKYLSKNDYDEFIQELEDSYIPYQ